MKMRILGTVCARGGSKGIKNKNIRELNGQPLISYTIQVLSQWSRADRIVCSTDSPEIAKIANRYGAETPFLRPKELATDTAAKLPVLQHALRYCEEEENSKYDLVVDLQPTSPLRDADDIERGFNEFIRTEPYVLYSVCESKENPYFTMVELDIDGYARPSKALPHRIVRRQDAPKVYRINGSIYFYDRNHLLRAKGLHTEKERIFEMDEIKSIDIDSNLDFEFTEFLLKSKNFEFNLG
jgi:N-acylneuraminate cytidylyltransferase/CMP-N,N'-diacetyllegionaminic acid synthase